VVAVAAGMVYSVTLTEDGSLFYWVSSDPDLRCQQVLFAQPLLNFSYPCNCKILISFNI
jgi:hypothetical protein